MYVLRYCLVNTVDGADVHVYWGVELRYMCGCAEVTDEITLLRPENGTRASS